MMTSSPNTYVESLNMAMKCFAELEITWRDMANRGDIDQYTAHQGIVEIGLARERLLDDYFA
jgi:hypothetical protein